MSHLRHPNPNFTGFAFDGDSDMDLARMARVVEGEVHYVDAAGVARRAPAAEARLADLGGDPALRRVRPRDEMALAWTPCARWARCRRRPS